MDNVYFFDQLYQGQRGFVEIAVARSASCKRVNHAKWFSLDKGTTADLARVVADIAESQGRRNVYVSSTTYCSEKREDSQANPSCVIFVDDAPEGEYSMVVQTSEHSRHGYLLLNETVPNDVRLDLSKRAADALGADRSGSDISQLVRVPGTWNTKRAEPFHVRLESVTGAVYTTQELEDRFPPVAGVDAAESLVFDQDAVECAHGNLQGIYGSDGIPARLTQTSYTRKLLMGALKGKSSSEDRQAVATGCVQHGYSNEVILAVLLDLCDYGRSRQRGMKALIADCKRCIEKARAKYPACQVREIDRMSKPARSLNTSGRRQRDVTALALFACYRDMANENGNVCYTVAEIARELGMGEKTVRRRERELIQSGVIGERQVSEDRQRSWVVLSVDKPALNDCRGMDKPALLCEFVHTFKELPDALNGTFTFPLSTHTPTGTSIAAPNEPAAEPTEGDEEGDEADAWESLEALRDDAAADDLARIVSRDADVDALQAWQRFMVDRAPLGARHDAPAAVDVHLQSLKAA